MQFSETSYEDQGPQEIKKKIGHIQLLTVISIHNVNSLGCL